MDNKESSNIFHRFWKWTLMACDGGDLTGSPCTEESHDGFTSESRIVDIQRAEQAQRAALTQRAERLCNAEKARADSVLERLGLSVGDATLPSPQPPALPRRSRKSSVRGRRISPLLDGPRLNVEDVDRNQKIWNEEENCWDQVHLGSQTALAFKEASMGDEDRSPVASISSVYSLSSVDTHTPSELRAISLIESPIEVSPTPPQAVPLPRRRASRLPVLSAKFTRQDKEESDRFRLQTAKNKVEAIVETLERFHVNSHPSPRPPAAAKKTPRTSVVKPLVPTPPKDAQTKRRGSRPGTFLHPAKAASGAGKKTVRNSSKTANATTVERQRLRNPVESLSLCFKLLASDDWKKKMDALETIQALAQHHSGTLKTKLHEVCLVLIEEVKNLRSAVACAAMNTVAELYVHLQKAMDPEAERTGRALLLKLAQTTNAFIHQQANLALDAMVENCSHGRIVTTLLNTGMNHRCVAVRASMAQHLHQLADKLGVDCIMTAGKSFTERFVTAVSKMSVDAASDVRHHGQSILQDLVLHGDFLHLWTKIIPEKDRRPLDKILKKTRK
ncbi:uncharacterized protein LOC108893160 [Lates calcarifer]|uniref:Uncharacterized protein LOC108893160 n=1 Tax=Lates calcarifer TaxID=8187 RepID=A0AAJ7Q4E3_LATCA|nr:uncharacterized protein LOC108893160 [Lates calcarifer]